LALKNFVGLPPDQLPFSAVKTLLARVGDQRLHIARQVLTQLADILTAHVDEP